MDINIALTTTVIEDIKKYKTLFEKIDALNYIIEIENNITSINKDFDNTKNTLEVLINNFLDSIDTEFIITYGKELRIGIFYSNKEYAFLSLEFSHQLISKLNSLSLNVEINSYIV